MRTRGHGGRFASEVPTCGHSNRRVHGNGLCGSCYQRQWIKSSPERIKKRKERYVRHISNGGAATANWRYRLKINFRLNEAAYKAKLAEQGGVCKICGGDHSNPTRRRRRMPVDHCHKTGTVRGILCDRCNRAIGMFEDRVDLLSAALAYLQSYAVVEAR